MATDQGQAETHEASGGTAVKRYHVPVSKSYTFKVLLVSVVVAVMTVAIACGVLAVSWDAHFQTYTRDNMQRLATATADAVGDSLEASRGDWYAGALGAAASASSLNDTVNISVVDDEGNVLYDDGNTRSDGALSLPRSSDDKGTASAPIIVNGEHVGTVYVSVFGSDALVTQEDQAFRDKSYGAMLMAAVIAVIAALIVGYFFARKLVQPINKIASAANEIKEGNYAARANIQGNDEVARLGKTFDLMAESVEQNRKLERRLVTDVAHELRTPLMAIQATVEAIIDGVYEADEEHLETLNSEIRRLSRLVSALLKLSRLENRSTPMELTKVELGDLVETIVSTHRAYVEDAGLTLEFNRDPEIYVRGNADNLRQATANLISNAVRYTPEGGTITVTAHKGDIMGQIIVSDTGIGLTPEEAKMVFSRFWRADKGRARDTGGLGIGLSVVKEIVDQHGGWVHVEGRPNEGSTFTIYIPLYREEKAKRRGGRRENGKNFF